MKKLTFGMWDRHVSDPLASTFHDDDDSGDDDDNDNNNNNCI
jgi:hypothetical protein